MDPDENEIETAAEGVLEAVDAHEFMSSSVGAETSVAFLEAIAEQAEERARQLREEHDIG